VVHAGQPLGSEDRGGQCGVRGADGGDGVVHGAERRVVKRPGAQLPINAPDAGTACAVRTGRGCR
jgi:hypothetical protein